MNFIVLFFHLKKNSFYFFLSHYRFHIIIFIFMFYKHVFYLSSIFIFYIASFIFVLCPF